MQRAAMSGWALTLLLIIIISALITQRMLAGTGSNDINFHSSSVTNIISSIPKNGNGSSNTTSIGIKSNAPNKLLRKGNVSEETVINLGKKTLGKAVKTNALRDVNKSTQSKNSSNINELDKQSHSNFGETFLNCFNQTRCIQPITQLKRNYNVYFCKHINYGVRFYFLAKEGLLLHPNIRLVSHPDQAEIIIYLPVSSEWKKSECGDPKYFSKLVVLDEGDGQGLFEPPQAPKNWYVLYFKRSYVKRRDGIFRGYLNYVKKPDVFPLTYPIAEAYVHSPYIPFEKRDMQLVCTLRGMSSDPVRTRVRDWVAEYAKARGLKKYSAGEINHDSRTVISKDYFGQMHRAQIIVTANPSAWEGDFRLMEAFGSGALVFVDRMFVPRPFPLLHGKHVVYYDNSNKTELFDALDYYRSAPQRISEVATSGYLYAMQYHRAANLMDYVFRTLHTFELTSALSPAEKKLVTASSASSNSPYLYTGFQMRQLALEAASVLKQLDRQKRSEN